MKECYSPLLPPGQEPYAYQMEVGRRLLDGRNLVLRAPTGAGKTLAALVPFILGRKAGRYSRLIYALPLRTLVRSIHAEAQRMVDTLAPELRVTMQTGEQPDDPFFALGDIIVCTYDQLLSGLLAAPYGIPSKLANVNAACVTGALVVFDEFHLMAPDRAFLTGAACLAQFGQMTQSLWMSATATEPLVQELADALGAECILLQPEEWAQVPSVARVRRTLCWNDRPLTTEEVETHRGKRVIVILNQVERARLLFQQIPGTPDWPVELLHSRFFREHREAKETWLRERFGKEGSGPGLLICTQVIEAGIDITSDVLLTELAPINALVQRAGRCARFPPAATDGSVTSGEVHVFALPEEEKSYLPYREDEIQRSRDLLSDQAAEPTLMDPARAQDWVQSAHGGSDALLIQDGWQKRQDEATRRIYQNVFGRGNTTVSDLIREVDENVRVIVADAPPASPTLREPLPVSCNRLRRLLGEPGADGGWAYVSRNREMVWEPLTQQNIGGAYYVTLPLSVAGYTREAGLALGEEGKIASPRRQPPERPGHGSLQEEPWTAHTRAVLREALLRAARELPAASGAAIALKEQWGLDHAAFLNAVRLTALFHDFGKLQDRWQRWALAYQEDLVTGYVSRGPLAHTQFDRGKDEDRQRDERVTAAVGKRPTHAVQSAYFARWKLGSALAEVDEGMRGLVCSACCAAIVTHHGGGLPEVPGPEFLPLWDRWHGILPFLGAHGIDALYFAEADRYSDKVACLLPCLEATTHSDNLAAHWPLLALLMRTLRLSDQKATAEGSTDG